MALLARRLTTASACSLPQPKWGGVCKSNHTVPLTSGQSLSPRVRIAPSIKEALAHSCGSVGQSTTSMHFRPTSYYLKELSEFEVSIVCNYFATRVQMISNRLQQKGCLATVGVVADLRVERDTALAAGECPRALAASGLDNVKDSIVAASQPAVRPARARSAQESRCIDPLGHCSTHMSTISISSLVVQLTTEHKVARVQGSLAPAR
jgi:hypothetical protein